MRQIFNAILAAVLVCGAADAKARDRANSWGQSVRGYTTRRGTVVAPHWRSVRDATRRNNWSTKGNINPETGKPGTK